MISVGDKIDTSLSFKFFRHGEKSQGTLADLLDRPAVVSVYMRNNTSVCDVQTVALQGHLEEIEALGYQVIAISKDTCGSHQKYAAKHGLSYTLVSDPDKAFGQATDSMVEKSMYGKKYLAPLRAAYVIATDGTILGVIPEIEAEGHGEEIVALLRQLAS